MRRLTLRITLPAAVLALLLPLAACGSDGGDGGSDGGPGGGGSDALAFVPASATRVTVVQRAEAAERAGVGDVETGADRDQIGDYTDALLARAPWAGTPLDNWLSPMNEGGVFSSLDVAWSAQFSADEGPLTTVYGVPDLDLGAFGADLEERGFSTEDDGGATTYAVDLGAADVTGLVDGVYPAVDFRTVTLVPDEQLVVTGPAEEVLAVVAGDADSAAEGGAFDAVGAGLAEAEYLQLADGPTCSPGRATPDQVAESGIESLETPEALSFAILGDGTVRNVFAFGDGDAASSDASAREAYLETGTSTQTREPISDVVSEADVSTAGAVETVDYTLPDGPQRAFKMAELGDVINACNPS